jgi:hypothetical protein
MFNNIIQNSPPNNLIFRFSRTILYICIISCQVKKIVPIFDW